METMKFSLQRFTNLLVAVYIFPSRAWSDAEITQLLAVRLKAILAGDLYAKTLFEQRSFKSLR